MVEKVKFDEELTSNELSLMVKYLYGQVQFLLTVNKKMAKNFIKLSNFCLGIDKALRESDILSPEEIERACLVFDEMDQKKSSKHSVHLSLVPEKTKKED